MHDTLKTHHVYQCYLASTAIIQAADRAGVRLMEAVDISSPMSEHRARRFEEAVNGERVPDHFHDGIYGTPLRMTLGSAFDGSTDEQREHDLLTLLAQLPGAKVVRYSGTTYLFGKHGAIEWTICCGEALCERVQTGTRTVRKPDPEAVAELTKFAPVVEVEEPVFEWRCNDAELSVL